MDYITDLTKTRDGWKAKTYIVLPDVRAYSCHSRPDEKGETKLTISTSKHSHSGLSSYASVAFHGEHFTTHAMGMGIGCGDYGRTVLKSGDRCTERAVARLHAEALTLVDIVMIEVRAHYAARMHFEAESTGEEPQ